MIRNKRTVFDAKNNHHVDNQLNNAKPNDDNHIIQWPLEACPIQKAVIDYGKRTAYLGSMHAVSLLEKYYVKLLKIKSSADLDDLISKMGSDIKKIKFEFQSSYDDD